jgi:DNA modification methylase
VTLPAATLTLKRRGRRNDVEDLAAHVVVNKKDTLRLMPGDTVEVMRSLPAGCATVVCADPPYNNATRYDADPTGDDLTPDDYLAWTREWGAAAARLLNERGSFFLMIDDAYQDLVGVELRKLGLFRRRTIVWWENFPVHTNGNFPAAARYLHYFTKASKGFTWHPERILVESGRNRLGDKRGAHGGKTPDCVWAVTRKVGNATDRVPFEDAPPQIPVEVPERCVLVASEPGDLVVDPFNGNGQTAIAALLNGRRYVGIDRSKKYLAQSEQWIKAQLAEVRADGNRGGRGK